MVEFDLDQTETWRSHVGDFIGRRIHSADCPNRDRQHDDDTEHHHDALHDVSPNNGVKAAVSRVDNDRDAEHQQTQQIGGVDVSQGGDSGRG